MIREITDIYNRNLISIIGMNLIIGIPFTFFIFIALNYFYGLETVEWKNLVAGFLVILNFTALFPPFFSLAVHELRDQSIGMKKMIKVFFDKFGYIVFFTLVIYMIGMLGYFLLFIPTIIATMALLLIPLYTDKSSIKKSWESAWGMMKQENIFILLDVLIILSLNVLVWSGSLYLVAGFENNTFVYISMRVLLNAMFFPLIYFYLTIKYRKDLSEDYDNEASRAGI